MSPLLLLRVLLPCREEAVAGVIRGEVDDRDVVEAMTLAPPGADLPGLFSSSGGSRGTPVDRRLMLR
jgi:hypothetical protein